MILHLASDAPVLLRAGATGILVLHIGAAFLGLASGGVAMVARKGARTHRVAGHVFFVSMLIMSSIGAAVAAILPARISTVAGLLTFYLVATSWVTVRRRDGRVGRFEVAALVLALGVTATGVYFGWLGANSPGGVLDRLPYQPALVFAALAGLGAFGDLRMIRNGGLSGAPRLARHIWRMCTALLIATLSFTGQPAAIPKFLQGSPLLFLPILAVAASMTYWLIRIRLGKRRKLRVAVAS